MLQKVNQESFLEDLGNLDWRNVLLETDIDLATEAFNSNLVKVLDQHAPIIQKRIRLDNPAWLSDELLNAIKEQDFGCDQIK